MNPDSNREWFIYFKEKEMGPLPESQVKLRFTQGEFDGTAFVFTEGMSDWVAIDEVEVFVENPEAASDAVPVQTIAPTEGSIERSTERSLEQSIEQPTEKPTKELAAELTREELSAEKDNQELDLSSGPQAPEGVEEQRFEESAGVLPSIERELQGSGLQVEKLGASQNEPDFLREEAPGEAMASAETSSDAKPGKMKFVRWAFLFFAALLAGAVFFDLAKVTDGGQPAFMKALLGDLSEFRSGDAGSELEQAEGSAGDSASDVSASDKMPNKEEIVWRELRALRNSKDGSVAPFQISSQLFSEGRPIVTGAVSSLLGVDRVHLLVMPDLPRSTMAHPRFWWFSLALVDGYFAAGPLNIDGEVLPEGNYRVWAQAAGKFLGEVSFMVGALPRGPEAEVIAKELQNRRQMRAAEERGFLEDKVSELSQLYDLLRKDSIALAIKGVAKRKEWEASQQAWSEAFENTQLQLNAAALASYYPEFQASVVEFSNEMLRMKGLMDLYNKSGRAAFEKRAGTRFTPLWNALKNDRDALVAEASELEGLKVDEVFVNEEAAKAVLLGLE